jgi:hypothetical protein
LLELDDSRILSNERRFRRTNALPAANYRAGGADGRISRIAIHFLPANMGRDGGSESVAEKNPEAAFLHTPASQAEIRNAGRNMASPFSAERSKYAQ